MWDQHFHSVDDSKESSRGGKGWLGGRELKKGSPKKKFVRKTHTKNNVARNSFLSLPYFFPPKHYYYQSQRSRSGQLFSLLNNIVYNTSIENQMNDKGRSFISDLFRDL